MDGFYCGDIIGNSYTHENESYNNKTKNFELFTDRSKFSDDTILTFATIKFLMQNEKTPYKMAEIIKEFYSRYPDKNPTIYGQAFASWAENGCKTFRESLSNGGAMRISPVGWFASTSEEIDSLVDIILTPTHNTQLAKEGARVICYSIFFLRQGLSKEMLKDRIEEIFKIDLGENINEYRNKYAYTSSAIETVRPALISFLSSNSYEDCIRNAVSFGGDTDTITTIASSIAEAFYGVDEEIKIKAYSYLPKDFKELLSQFNNFISNKNISLVKTL